MIGSGKAVTPEACDRLGLIKHVIFTQSFDLVSMYRCTRRFGHRQERLLSVSKAAWQLVRLPFPKTATRQKLNTLQSC
jgi:hypothetical protein